MTTGFAYDLAMATKEVETIGETASLFAEIRQTMRIPLVTSIRRELAGMDDSLRLAWVAAKPIYASSQPKRVLTRGVAAVGLPSPGPRAPTALAGLWTRWRSVRKVKEGKVEADIFGFLTCPPNAVGKHDDVWGGYAAARWSRPDTLSFARLGYQRPRGDHRIR
jgi:hypothetical protein